MKSKYQSQSQRERLENILSTQMPHFSNRMLNYLNNKISYLSKLNFVSIPVHIELLIIAKKRPDTFFINDIIKFLTTIVEDRNKDMPKALATTLFMIFGHVYRNQIKPPLIMAKLLFRDVIDSQEFCHFEKAAEFIQRVQLTYFFPPSLLSAETRLALYRQSKPAAEEVPNNFLKWDTDLEYNLAEVQKSVNTEFKLIKEHEKDPRYADILVFFMTMPEGQETFINEFNYLCDTFPSYIPQMFQSVQFFLLHANANEPLASDFAKQFAQLNPTICVDEYKDALSKITTINQLYFPIISGAKLSFSIQKDILNAPYNLSSIDIKSEAINQNPMQLQSANLAYGAGNDQLMSQIYNSNSSRNANDQIVQYLIQAIFKSTDEVYFENLKKLNDQYSQTKPPLSYTCEVLTKFLEVIPIKEISIDNVSRIISTFDLFLKNTIYTNSQQPQQQQKKQQPPQSPVNGINYIEIAELISLFVTKLSQTQALLLVSKSLSSIIVPSALKNDGLPFKHETLVPFISKPELNPIAYTMIYSAAKYQIKCNSMYPAVYGTYNPIIDKSITNLCKSQFWNVGAKAFALGCILIVISPDVIGANIYFKEDRLCKMFRSFLRKFLGRSSEPSELLEDVNFEEQVNDNEGMKKFVARLSKLRYLSSDAILHCRSPVNYLDHLLSKEEKLTTIPKYINAKITNDMIETLSFVALSKFIYVSLISIAMSRNNISVSEIYRQEKVCQWVSLVLQKKAQKQDVAEMLMYFAKFLEKKERSLRVSAYVIILILNAEIVNDKNAHNSGSLSFDSSSENSSISIGGVPPTATATSVFVPLYSQLKGNLAGNFIVFKFHLPDNEETVGIISRSLYIDNEVEIAKAFVLFLSFSKFQGNALAEFVEKRPLLANCLQEPSLSKLLKSKVSYNMSYAPMFDYPRFNEVLALAPAKTQRYEYHNIQSKRPKLTDLSQFPIEDYPTVVDAKYIVIKKQVPQDDQNGLKNEDDFLNRFECIIENSEKKVNEFESSPLELEVYRYEMTLYASNSSPPAPNSEDAIKTFFYEEYNQWFALASLKRYVLNYSEAFLLYARPTLNVLYTEIGHANFLTKIMMNRFISLLSICYIKLINQSCKITEKEQLFVHEVLLPKLEEISNFDQMKQYSYDLPPMVPALLNSILNNFDSQFASSAKQKFAHCNLNSISSSLSNSYFSKKNIDSHNINNNVSSFVMPHGIPFEMIVEKPDMVNTMQQSIIVTTDEFASKWLLDAAVQCPSVVLQNKNFTKNLLIPLILSASKDAVVDFFRLMKEQNPDDTQKLMDTVASAVNSVFIHKK